MERELTQSLKVTALDRSIMSAPPAYPAYAHKAKTPVSHKFEDKIDTIQRLIDQAFSSYLAKGKVYILTLFW